MALPDGVRALRWEGDAENGVLWLLDQRLLPAERRELELRSAAEVARAIREMAVRGAPAIGIAAAYGAVLAARSARGAELEAELERLGRARPTAVNLGWALERVREALAGGAGPAELLELARRIHREDLEANRRMGELGADLIAEDLREQGLGAVRLLTHCNTGSLATGGFGTALGVVRAAWARGLVSEVLADETRPWLQGARLTAWELLQDGIPARLLADGAAAWAMRRLGVRWVVVGADRVAANGDFANKIGTYGLAVAARRHGLRFMVVAPSSTLDPSLPDGEAIPVEERAEDEVLSCGGRRLAPGGARAWNPAFDVTPAELVDALVTERGVLLHPGPGDVERLLAGSA